MTELSVIIASYNTKDILRQCLDSLTDNFKKNQEIQAEIIVVDNNSTDGTCQMLDQYKSKTAKIIVIKNRVNKGYSAANNLGIKACGGKYVLFLNSDVIVNGINFKKILNYLDIKKEVGVLTAKVLLPTGKIDPACHRGFPTLWRSFCYFAKLEYFFGKVGVLNKLFGGYHLKHLDMEKIHEIDSPSGAFYLTRREILDKTGFFDEHFFMYGEDLDLSFRIKEQGYRIIYYPEEKVLHMKYKSGMKSQDQKTKINTRGYFFDAMKIFYNKHYKDNYPVPINNLVYFLIDRMNVYEKNRH